MKVPDGPKKHLDAQPRFRRDKDKISVNLGVKVCYEIMLNVEIFLILSRESQLMTTLCCSRPMWSLFKLVTRTSAWRIYQWSCQNHFRTSHYL